MKRKLTILFITILLIIFALPKNVYSGTEEGDTDLSLTVEAACGNGIVDTGEECDGSAGVPDGYSCNSQCQLESQGGIIVPEVVTDLDIYNIFSDIDIDEAEIDWSTNKDAICELNWGETEELMDGILKEIEKERGHKVLLEDLLSNTDYWYKIYCYDEYGHKDETDIKRFTTKKPTDITAPANVSDFRARAEGENIILTWINPKDDDFRAVKIMRSESFYPQHIKDGKEIYNDSGESFIDRDVRVGVRYYYTAFSYDNNGNYSSGSLASAIISEEALEELLPLPGVPVRPEEMIEIFLSDFFIYVANETIEIKRDDNSFELLPGTILDVKTLKSKYPKRLKSIIITHAPREGDRVNDAKSYLLRIDDKENFYATRFTSPEKIKDYDFYLYFLNYNNALIAEAEGLFKVEKYGKVTNINFFSPFIKSAKAAGANGNNNKSVYGAGITLYKYEDDIFKRWQGEKFSQFNPLLSNKLGQYGFLVPNGRYFLKVNKDGFYKYTSLPFQVENNLVKENIELIQYPMFDYKRFLLNLLILLILYILYKTYKNFKDQDKNRENENFVYE